MQKEDFRATTNKKEVIMGKYSEMVGEGLDIVSKFFKKPKPKPKKKDTPYRDTPTGDTNWAKRRKNVKKQLDETERPFKKGK